jgi:hypothetical protein
MSLNTNSFIVTNVLEENNLNEINGSNIGDIVINLKNNNNNKLFFQSGVTNNQSGLCISSTNNIGFGTTDIKEKIDISGGIITNNYKLQSVIQPIIDISNNIKAPGNINISKGLAINDNKFIVDTSGNTKISGNVDISSNLNLNNVFSINSNANITTTGKLDISGSLNINNNFSISNTGDVLIKGLLDVTNKTTFNKDVSLNNGILDIGINRTLYIDSLNNRVGIGGLPDTSYNFHVKGNTKIKGDLVINGTTSIQDTSNNTVTSFDLTNNGTGPAIIVNQLGTQPVATFKDDNKTVLYIGNNGLTGVGKADPSYNLDISGTALVKQNLTVNNSLTLLKTLTLSFKISQISTSGITSYFIREGDGAVFGSGSSDTLQFGVNQTSYINNSYKISTPIQIKNINNIGFLTGITQVSANYFYSFSGFALLLRGSDGVVFAMGSNHYGNFGNGIRTNHTGGTEPSQVKGENGVGFITGITQISAGYAYSLFLRGSDGAVFGCGFDNCGQLGTNVIYSNNLCLTLQRVKDVDGIQTITGITQISAGQNHALFLRGSDGAVFASGDNSYGILGNGTTVASRKLVQVKGVDGIGFITGITQISAGGYHSLFLRESDGAVFGCGMNTYGVLGIDNYNESYTTLQQVKGVNGVGFITGITQIAAGVYHSLFLRGSDGAVFSCGGGISGSPLGTNNGGNGKILQQVKGVNGIGYITGITKITAKQFVSLFLRDDGVVFGCGYNLYGQLGIGNFTNQSTLQQAVDETGNIPQLVSANTSDYSVILNNHSTVNNNLDISGGIIINDKLKVDASGNLDTSGNVNVAGTVTVYGNISQSGTFNQEGDIDVSGNAILKGNLDISKNLRVNADKFTVDPSSGNIISKGTMDISGYFNVNNTFKIDSGGNISSIGTLDISKNFSINQSNLIIDSSGNVKSKGQIDVSNNFIVNTNKFIVDSSGNVQIPGTLDVSNNLTVNNNKFVVISTSGNIQSAGNVDISKNFSINTNKFIVDLSGNVQSAGTLDISNNLTINNNKFIIDTSGNVKSAGNFDISGNFSLNTNSILIDNSGNITANGKLSGIQNLSINNNNFYIDSSGNAIAKGNFDLSQNMSVGTNIFKTNIDNNYIGLNTYIDLSNNIHKNIFDISGNIGTSTGFFGDISNSIIMSHRDYANDTQYLIKQSSSGEISINSKSLTETIDICFDNIPQCKFNNDGDMTINGTIYTYSDIRIKENIKVIEDALEKVKGLQGIKYNLINEDETKNKKHIGLLAQDVEKVVPEAIETDGDIKTVAYGNLVGLLIQAIKELDNKYKYMLLNKPINNK